MATKKDNTTMPSWLQTGGVKSGKSSSSVSYTPTTNKTLASGGGTQGNYSIGSDYGKKQAQNMGVGTSWVATDGSTWTKENDGTITVNYNGTTTKNAWRPTDLGTSGLQQVQAGVPYQYVQNTLNERVAKALGTEGLEQYAYDDTYQTMYNYIQSQMAQGNQQEAQDLFNQWLQQYEQNNPKPTYTSNYDPQINDMLNKILNRDDFSYDVANDPLYQQYKQMYQREGDRAMRETLAEAAASAGGMNTYAITAAQQANNYYNSQLNDRIPELYQLAYDMYLNDKESMVQDLGLLQNMDATQYNRYRDTMNDYYNDKTFAYGAFNDAVNQGNWQTTFDYNSLWDNLNFNNNNYWTNKGWDSNQSQLELENSRVDQATADEKLRAVAEGGNMPSDELILAAGWNKSDVEKLVEAARVAIANKTKSKGGSGKGSDIDDDEEDEEITPKDDVEVVDGVEIPKNEISNIMTRQEWGSRRGSHESSGQGGIEVSEYNTYEEYYDAMIDYLKLKYSEN